MNLLIEVKDSKVAFIMELLKNFSFVKTKTISPEKELLMEDIREAVKEVKLHKQGKIKLKTAEELLNEL